MNRKTIKISFIAVLVTTAVVFYFAMSEYRRKHKDIAVMSEEFTLSSHEILHSFSRDEKEANNRFLDKVISVTGIVKSVDRDDEGGLTIVLGDSISMSAVRCSIDSNHNTEAAMVLTGANVSVKGVCSGYYSDELLGSDVVLNRCAIKNYSSFKPN